MTSADLILFLLPLGLPLGRFAGVSLEPLLADVEGCSGFGEGAGRFLVFAISPMALSRRPFKYLFGICQGGCEKTSQDSKLNAADFSSSICCKFGNDSWPNSCRNVSTSRFAMVYSPSVIIFILARSSSHLQTGLVSLSPQKSKIKVSVLFINCCFKHVHLT